jgi:hypothetical protein
MEFLVPVGPRPGHQPAESSPEDAEIRPTAFTGAASSAVPSIVASRVGGYPPRPPFPPPNATVAVACLGNSNTAHTRCIQPIASWLTHRRSPITPSFRFIRPARWMGRKRNFFIRTVRSSTKKLNPRVDRSGEYLWILIVTKKTASLLALFTFSEN